MRRWEILCVALSCLALGLAAAALMVALSRPEHTSITITPACTSASAYGCLSP